MIQESKIIEEISKMIKNSNICLPTDVSEKMKENYHKSKNLEKKILKQIIKNYDLALEKGLPLCQDTGNAVFFVEIGNEVHLNYNLEIAINKGVIKGYEFLRKSIVRHPLERINTKNNTNAIIHFNLVLGNKIKITYLAKGAGAENMSALKMLKPSDGYSGVIDFVLETIKNASGKPCPPIVVGIGIGGNFEMASLLAKKALVRNINDEAIHEIDQKLEKELLEKINELNIGAMGIRGDFTALAVKVNSYPCHIASLPVAVNIGCHVSRHETIILENK